MGKRHGAVEASVSCRCRLTGTVVYVRERERSVDSVCSTRRAPVMKHGAAADAEGAAAEEAATDAEGTAADGAAADAEGTAADGPG